MPRDLSRYQHTRCYRLGWVLERVGWGFMAAAMLAAAIGLFGGGWLSSSETAGSGAMTVRYPRFGRAHSPFQVEVEWTARQRDAALWIERAYLDQFAIDEVRPPPVAVTLDSRRIQYSFLASQPDGRVAVVFTLRARHGGRFTGSLGFDQTPGLAIRQYLFP